MKALIVLRPPESKKLIAEAVIRMDVVKEALESGLLIIGAGSTNGEIAARCRMPNHEAPRFLAGMITRSTLCVTPREQRLPNLVLVSGKNSTLQPKEALEMDVSPKVLIKGANAIDPDGNCGVLMAAPDGGTVGRLLGPFMSAGWPIITPVGLEKLIPSVPNAVRQLGRWVLDRSLGASVGMMPLMNTLIVTEIEALSILAGVSATLVAAGGICGSEGAVTLVMEGEAGKVNKVLDLVEEFKGSETPQPPVQECAGCTLRCDYRGKSGEDLPRNLR